MRTRLHSWCHEMRQTFEALPLQAPPRGPGRPRLGHGGAEGEPGPRGREVQAPGERVRRTEDDPGGAREDGREAGGELPAAARGRVRGEGDHGRDDQGLRHGGQELMALQRPRGEEEGGDQAGGGEIRQRARPDEGGTSENPGRLAHEGEGRRLAHRLLRVQATGLRRLPGDGRARAGGRPRDGGGGEGNQRPTSRRQPNCDRARRPADCTQVRR